MNGAIWAVLFGIAIAAMGLTVLYGLPSADNKFVRDSRSRIAWGLTSPGGFRVLPAMLPGGVATVLMVLGVTLAPPHARAPSDPWADLVFVGLALFAVALWFGIWPPNVALPRWYREERARRGQQLPPVAPEPPEGAHPVISRRVYYAMLGATVVVGIAGVAAGVRAGALAIGIGTGLAILARARIRP